MLVDTIMTKPIWFGFGSPSIRYGPLTLIFYRLVVRLPWLERVV